MEQGPLIRTGTLIAVRLTRSDGFSAREAMGWLRIMRPGSILGEQVLAVQPQKPLLACNIACACHQ